MMREQLDAYYRRYIACLNERRLDEAALFYAEELNYNGEMMSRDRWRRTAIEESLAAIPDFKWQVEHLVIDGDFLAARLRDSGTLRLRWRGLVPTGKFAVFGENVFYRFQGERINEVWSIVDALALEGSA